MPKMGKIKTIIYLVNNLIFLFYYIYRKVQEKLCKLYINK